LFFVWVGRSGTRHEEAAGIAAEGAASRHAARPDLAATEEDMTRTKIVAAIALADFFALNALALYYSGLDGLVAFVAGASWWGWVLMADLVLALAVAVGWMWRDALSRGERPLALTALTAFTGSFGPLIYVLRRREV
jgi:hypothetical protein